MGRCFLLDTAAFNISASLLLLSTFSLNKYLQRGEIEQKKEMFIDPWKQIIPDLFSPWRLKVDVVYEVPLFRGGSGKWIDLWVPYAVGLFFKSASVRAKLVFSLWTRQAGQAEQDVSSVQSEEPRESKNWALSSPPALPQTWKVELKTSSYSLQPEYPTI